MRPEEALTEARRRAAEYSPPTRGEGIEGLTIEPTDRVGLEQLIEWAVAEPDSEKVRSTRALGAPITALKRGLVHLTRQQTGDLLAQQARFNLHLLTRVAELEERVKRLEDERAG
jgi:hypothetical protein